jgi:hypothetical protein
MSAITGDSTTQAAGFEEPDDPTLVLNGKNLRLCTELISYRIYIYMFKKIYFVMNIEEEFVTTIIIANNI